MAQETRRAFQIIQEWWGVVAIGVAILGGYWWLEQNFARLDKLAAEKCSLSYEIRLTRARIEFASTDEEIDLQRTEYEALLLLPNPPQKRIQFKIGFIESLEKRIQAIDEEIKCLGRAKDMCFQGDVTTDKCYDQSAESQTGPVGEP